MEAAGPLLVFSTASMKSGSTASIAVGDHPAHVVVDKKARRAFVTLSGEDVVAAIDLNDIDVQPPSLFEMKTDNPTNDPDCKRHQYSIRFEPRQVEDIGFEYPTRAFERVRQVSEFNEQIHRTFVSPWVRTLSTPWTAHAMQWLHPMRANRSLFSETFVPWMGAYSVLADAVSKHRHAFGDDQPLMAQGIGLSALNAQPHDLA